MVKKKAGTITFAIGLIIVGALLFAENFTTLPIKDFYKYWPVLLIGLGAEFLIFSIIYSRGSENVRISIDGLCVVFIIIMGLASNMGNIMNFDLHLGDKGKSLLDFNSNYKAEMKESFAREDVSANYNIKEIKISNDFGEIEVKPSDSKFVKVEAEMEVKYNDEIKAREYIKNAINIEEGELTEISVNLPSDGSKKDFSKAIVNFTIFIPDVEKVNVETSFGDINVADIKGELTVNNNYGAVVVNRITGNIIVKNSFGKINVSDINGDAKINNQNGQISVEKVTGSAQLETHFGGVKAKNIDANLTVENNNGSIEVDGVGSNADVKGSFGSIDVKDINGNLEVKNSNGRIGVKDVDANVNIKNSFGSIDYVSNNIKDADILVKTDFGNIRCDEGINITKSGQQSKAEGKTGSGKNKIQITNTNGDININD